MCKEDVRIARKAGRGLVKNNMIYTSPLKVLGGNPNRYSLTLSGNLIVDTPGEMQYVAGINVNGIIAPLLCITPDHMIDRVNIVDIGEVICEEIWIDFFGSGQINGYCLVETQWTDKLENL